MATPTFLGIGAQRAGTTYLHTLLSLHPEIVLPEEGTDPWNKEQHFFSRRILNETVADYEARFRPEAKPGGHLYGEITPAYSTLPHSLIVALSGYLPPSSTRIVFVVRNPLHRTFSGLKMYWKKRAAGNRLHDASLFTLIRSVERPGCVARTDYMRTLANWASVYGERNIRIVEFGELTNAPVGVLQELADFLGARDRTWFDQNRTPATKVHASDAGAIPPKLRRYLVWRWWPMVRELEECLGSATVPWAASIREEYGRLAWREKYTFSVAWAVAWCSHTRKRFELMRRHRRIARRMADILPPPGSTASGVVAGGGAR